MLLRTYLGLCLLRANPQDLPASSAVTLAAVVAYALMDVFGVLDIIPPASALLAAAVDTLLLVAATQLALRLRGFENRFSQTLAALAGSGALLSFAAWVVAALAGAALPPDWIWVSFLVWYTVIVSHVLRQALALPLAAAAAASLLYVMLSLAVTGLFIHPAPSEP
jgi:hypothetical protein